MPSSAHQHANKPESTSANKPKATTTPASLQSNLSIDQQTIMRIQRMAGNQAALRFVQRDPDDDARKRNFKANLHVPMYNSNSALTTGTLMTPLIVNIPGSPPGTVNANQPILVSNTRTVASSLDTQQPANIRETD